jgi:hypothetical protein
MKYRELLEYTKKYSGCLRNKEQRTRYSEYKYKLWLNKQNELTRSEKKNSPEN